MGRCAAIITTAGCSARSDPLSGQVALLEEAKAHGRTRRAPAGSPKRTIVYLSWDGEEPGLLGSTEWAETHADELKQKAVLYINSDSNARGFLGADGSQDLEHLVDRRRRRHLTDPETDVTRRRSACARSCAPKRVDPAARITIMRKAVAKIAADPSSDVPIEALGSGSDYSAFLEHLGLAALDIGYGGEGEFGRRLSFALRHVRASQPLRRSRLRL